MKDDNIFTFILSKYTNHINILCKDLVAKILMYTKINNDTINLVNSQYSSYRSIYNLSLVMLEILKTYMENNLANSFIKPSKFSTGAFIFYIKKPNDNL